MAKVFLSYAREDEAAAKQLAEGIGNAGHEVWWDRHIQGGSRFSTEIDRELKTAQVVVVLWSQASVDSAWVQDEAAEGRDSGRLVPVALGGSRPPLGFRQFHTIDLGTWNGVGVPANLNQLVEAITNTAGNKETESASARADVQKKAAGPSVCVLPFLNMSGDPEQEYFSDGITEDIITDLSKVSALSIVARNTAFNFKGTKIDVQELGRTLKISHVLEGSVRKAGARVRINAQLIDSVAGDHVWAERYDSELSDIFEIQDEISKAIVSALKLKLLPNEKKAIEQRGTDNPDAYNLYLKARQQWISGNDGNSRRDDVVVRICRQATTIDPRYARAWALMALAQAELHFMHNSDENALASAERALELDPALAEAHCVKARYLADEEAKPDEANREIEIALRLDPESWETNKEAGRLMYRQNRMKEAIPFLEKAATLIETDYHTPGLLTTCYASLGEADGMRRAAELSISRAEKALAQDPTNGAALGMGANCLARMGDGERTKQWAQSALLMDPTNLTMRYNLACGLARVDIEAALDLLDTFVDEMAIALITHLAIDPDMDPLRGEPRFQAILARVQERAAAQNSGIST